MTMLIPTGPSRDSCSNLFTPNTPSLLPVSFADWLALPEDKGAELLHGRIEYKAFPTLEHGRAQRKLGRFVDPFDCRYGGGGKPGGWWIGSEVDVIINGHGVRPDMVGWRRENHPKKPRRGPNGAIDARPDWIAEVLSPSNRDRDLKEKFLIYQDAEVPYYWVLDPEIRSLLIHYKEHKGYTYVDGGKAHRVLRARPFDIIELRIGSLFDEDDELDEKDEEDEENDSTGY